MSEGRPARRPALLALLALGVGLALAPVVFQMFSRAPLGADMIDDFRPLMTVERLDGFQQDIALIDGAVEEIDEVAPAHLGDLADVSPSYAALSDRWPTVDADMTGLLDDVQANRDNYLAVAALPFRAFPWLFALPGVVVAALAVIGLRRGAGPVVRGAVVVVGAAFLLAPVALQMFERAPKGAEMMDTFATIQTTENVHRIQGYFSTMAAGQGGIRLEVVPALQEAGVDVAADLPATTALNEQWIHVLNDMTPMIGAMSDNVAGYQAVASLPPFGLFPWFFVIPGVLLVGLAGVGLRPRPASAVPAEVLVPEGASP